MALQTFFDNHHWNVVDVLSTERREAELLGVDDLPLAGSSRAFLSRDYSAGIYRHQKEALTRSLAGENVCLVTGTASGKSLVFQTAAMELLSSSPNARVMAIYPMKALGNEQRDRWQNALVGAGLAVAEPGSPSSAENLVGRIDGNVPPGFRLNILERSRVVVFTPDIIHAWLFSNLNQPAVINFLREVKLIVVDEIHAYSGVFGSNSAFLFRRLQHLLSLLGASPRYICASATIAQPAAHLHSLFGLDFHLVGPEYDSSPRYPLQVMLVEPPGTDRFLDEVVNLLEFLTQKDPNATGSQRFIAFVDSRKQVELISSILNRLLKENAKIAALAAAEAEAAAAAASLEAAGDEEDSHLLPAPEPAPHAKGGWGRSRPGTKTGAKTAAKNGEGEPGADEPDPEGEVTGVLQQLNVLPYRAGYEDHDRRQIQERLAEGTLNGVVSTSALELGIDIPHLDICVLIGVPASATSLQQRIGRIGRHSPGVVIVVNGGDVHDQTVFAHPQSFFQRPLAESALYLENEHIQYIHALCLARQGGEHDAVTAAATATTGDATASGAKTTARAGAGRAGGQPAQGGRASAQVLAAARAAAARAQAKITGEEAAGFDSPVRWPENFLALCRRERAGDTPRQLVSLKLEARDRPNYTFPLRDVESQFKVERRDGPNVSSMGSLSFAQLMREAYPGAIYYYATIPYRVTRVNVKSKTVTVRREKRYTTQPQKMLPAVFPRLSPGGIFAAGRQDGLVALETSLLVRESIRGIVEQRGRTESAYPYPLVRELGLFQDQPYFSRNYFTTGVVLFHPALSVEGVNLEAVSAMVYEAFMLMIPFERQDIGYAADHFRASRMGENGQPVIEQGRAFLTVFDQTYGSLRLSHRLAAPGMMGRVLAEAALLGGRQESLADSPVSLNALVAMARAVFRQPREELSFSGSKEAAAAAIRDPERWERIVMPGSKGLMVRTNEEFHVLRILNTPAGLSYEGTPASMLGTGASLMPLLSDVAEIPGESEPGWYEIETGTLEPAAAAETLTLRPGDSSEPPLVDPAWLTHALAVYLSEEALARLAERMGRRADGSKAETVEALVSSFNGADLLDAALEVYLQGLLK